MERAMFKTSLPALFGGCLILATPAAAQDVSASLQPSAELSAPQSTSVQPDLSFDKDAGVDTGLTDEQTAEIGRILAAANVPPVTVDFEIGIGTDIPSTITLSPLPVEATTLAPSLSGYLFFVLDDGRIVLVSPNTLKVVLVIYA
jgi:hypothetical protein